MLNKIFRSPNKKPTLPQQKERSDQIKQKYNHDWENDKTVYLHVTEEGEFMSKIVNKGPWYVRTCTGYIRLMKKRGRVIRDGGDIIASLPQKYFQKSRAWDLLNGYIQHLREGTMTESEVQASIRSMVDQEKSKDPTSCTRGRKANQTPTPAIPVSDMPLPAVFSKDPVVPKRTLEPVDVTHMLKTSSKAKEPSDNFEGIGRSHTSSAKPDILPIGRKLLELLCSPEITHLSMHCFETETDTHVIEIKGFTITKKEKKK